MLPASSAFCAGQLRASGHLRQGAVFAGTRWLLHLAAGVWLEFSHPACLRAEKEAKKKEDLHIAIANLFTWQPLLSMQSRLLPTTIAEAITFHPLLSPMPIPTCHPRPLPMPLPTCHPLSLPIPLPTPISHPPHCLCHCMLLPISYPLPLPSPLPTDSPPTTAAHDHTPILSPKNLLVLTTATYIVLWTGLAHDILD